MIVFFSKEASQQYQALLEYLETQFSLKIRIDFERKMQKFMKVIRAMPLAFPESDIFPNCRRCVISPQTSIIYLVEADVIRIITILDNRSFLEI